MVPGSSIASMGGSDGPASVDRIVDRLVVGWFDFFRLLLEVMTWKEPQNSLELLSSF